MKVLRSALALSAALAALAGPGLAQDRPTHGHAMASPPELREACRTGEMPAMGGMEGMAASMEGMAEAQQALMEGMLRTQGR